MALGINELDVHIGKNIRHFRKKMRWGLKVLAGKLEISLQQLQKYETATNKISASLLYEVSKILQLPIEKLFQTFDSKEYVLEKSGFNILLIEDKLEDELVIRQAIDSFPEKTHVYSIGEGGKAMEFLQKMKNTSCMPHAKPDIVLLELNLQKCSGLDILKNIKRDRHLHSTPVVLLTDSTNPCDMQSSYTLNASGLVVKSCSANELRTQMHSLLSYWTQVVSLPRNGLEVKAAT